MKLTGNIVQTIVNAISRQTDTTPGSKTRYDSDISEFHSLIRARQEPEHFQEKWTKVFHTETRQNENLNPEIDSTKSGDTVGQQEDGINGTEADNGRQVRNFQPSYSTAIQLTVKYGSSRPVSGAATGSEVLQERRAHTGTTPGNSPRDKWSAVQSQNPAAKDGADGSLLVQKAIEPQIKAVAAPDRPRGSSRSPAVNPVPGLAFESTKAVLTSGRLVDDQMQKEAAPKEQYQNLRVERDRDNATAIRTMEQKPVLAPAALNITKAIIQNIYSPPTPAAVSNSLTVVPQGLSNTVQTIEIQLVPKNLGVVEVKISRSRGRLEIVIETKTRGAESLLRTELTSISNTLTASGLTTNEIILKHNPRLEQIDPREARIIGTQTDNSGLDNFNGAKKQQLATELERKSSFQPQNSKRISDLTTRVSSDIEHRSGTYW